MKPFEWGMLLITAITMAAIVAGCVSAVRTEDRSLGELRERILKLESRANDLKQRISRVDDRLPDSVEKALLEDRMQSHAEQLAALQGDVAELYRDKSAEIAQLQNIVLGHEKRLAPETFPEPNEPESCK